MILKYTGCPDPPDSPHHYELPGFVVGESYEVAEIFEMDGHVMARKPGDTRWPAPGETRFGIHPEWFEQINDPIPIISCGYEYNDILCPYFGVILEEPEHIEIVRALRRLEGPDDENGEEFEAWRKREASAFPREVAEALYEWLWHYPYDFGVVSDVFSIAPSIKAPFAHMGAYGDAMFWNDVRHADLKRCIDRVLRGFGITDREAGIVQIQYWRGNGSQRLINPISREKFLYGIEYEWESEELLDDGSESTSP